MAARSKTGYEIAVQQINAAGGVTVGGKKLQIEMTMLDDESDPTKTVARMETLASQGVVAYLGGAGSDLHAAAASIGDKNKIPYLGIAFALHGIHKQGLRYLFSPFPKSPDLTTETFVFLDALIPAAQRPRKVALFLERTDWGKEMGSGWESAAKKHGYQIAASGEYAPGSKDFSDLILKAKSAGAEAVLALPSPPDGMTIVKQMKELDFNPKVNLFIRAADPPVWSQNLSKDGDYVLFSPGWHFAAKYPKVAELNEAHQKLFNRPSDPLVGPSYACLQILADAVDARENPGPRQASRRHRSDKNDHGSRTGSIPLRWHRRGQSLCPAMAQGQTRIGLAQGVCHRAVRLSRAGVQPTLTAMRPNPALPLHMRVQI